MPPVEFQSPSQSGWSWAASPFDSARSHWDIGDEKGSPQVRCRDRAETQESDAEGVSRRRVSEGLPLAVRKCTGVRVGQKPVKSSLTRRYDLRT